MAMLKMVATTYCQLQPRPLPPLDILDAGPVLGFIRQIRKELLEPSYRFVKYLCLALPPDLHCQDQIIHIEINTDEDNRGVWGNHPCLQYLANVPIPREFDRDTSIRILDTLVRI